MSAQDNLSPKQFMSVKELGAYQSSDFPDKTMDQVHAMFRRDMLRSDRVNYKQGTLKNKISEEGMQTPVEVDPVNHVYGDGHHRYSAAKSLRMKEIPVTFRDFSDR